MKTKLIKLQEWYQRHCDGEWEHSWGIKIDTLDNPGWTVEINLQETIYENATWAPLFVDNNEEDWITCRKELGNFKGVGDPSKLEEILEYFLSNVE